jgi:1,2-diacylglycerol 3-beta-glucosyltransferase
MLALSILCLLAIPALLATGYLGFLTVFSHAGRARLPSSRRFRMAVVIPANDEAFGIERTVKNLLALDWPVALFDVLVVADNCTDATAELAARAGARVLERRDEERRGKGYALDFAFSRLLQENAYDAVVVVDADTVVSPNLIDAFAARLEDGALAVQAEYRVLNAEASWRTRLMAIAFSLFHGVRSLGRERLGLSCGLRGNGMCLTMEALRRVPHHAFSIVEDLEYGVRLGAAGIRVHFAEQAIVFGEMVARERDSRSQRRRWEGGRVAIARQHAAGLLRDGLALRSGLLLDLAIDLALPPLSLIAAYTIAGLLASALFAHWTGHTVPLLAWAAAGAMLLAYVGRGVALSGMGWRGWAALAWAPVFLIWKLTLAVSHPREKGPAWVRTTRQPAKKPE